MTGNNKETGDPIDYLTTKRVRSDKGGPGIDPSSAQEESTGPEAMKRARERLERSGIEVKPKTRKKKPGEEGQGNEFVYDTGDSKDW